MHTRRTGTTVDCLLSLPDIAVTHSVKVCAYRFVQEALNNAFKHADAKGQSVRAHATATLVEITVSDLGPGLRDLGNTATVGSLGLIGMRDRTETLGGELEVCSGDGGSTLVARFKRETLDRLSKTDAEQSCSKESRDRSD